MMRGSKGPTRRSVLRKTGLSIGTLLGWSGAASAADSQSDRHTAYNGGVKVEDGKFVLDATPEEIGQSTYRLTKTAVDNFNAIIEAGLLDIDSTLSGGKVTTSQSAQTSLIPSTKATTEDVASVHGVEAPQPAVPIDQVQAREDLNTGNLTPQSCNKDDVKTSKKYIPPTLNIDIYLSDGTITDLNAAASGGAPGGALIYKYLVRQGYIAAGALAGPVATVVFAAVAAYWGVVNIQNNGCGVVIKTGVSPVNPTVPTPTVSGQ